MGSVFFAIFCSISVLFIISCVVGIMKYDNDVGDENDVYVLLLLLSGGLLTFFMGFTIMCMNVIQ